MLLQVSEATKGFSELFDYSLSMGILGLVILLLTAALRVLWKRMDEREVAFNLVVTAKDGLISAKDEQIKEMNKDDKMMITEVTKTMTEMRSSIENTNSNALNKLNEIHNDVKKLV